MKSKFLIKNTNSSVLYRLFSFISHLKICLEDYTTYMYNIYIYTDTYIHIYSYCIFNGMFHFIDLYYINQLLTNEHLGNFLAFAGNKHPL